MFGIWRPLCTADPNGLSAVQDSKKPTSPNQTITEHTHAEAGVTNAAASRKRKLTKAPVPTPEAVKKTKTEPAAAQAVKVAVTTAAAELLDVSMCVYEKDGDDGEEQIPIYDTCDMVRRKIRAMLAKDGVTQAAFLRAIATAAYGDSPGAHRIQPSALNNFLRHKGPLAGNTSAVYYAAYVFFEKLRVKQDKPKSADREAIEEIHPAGIDTKVNALTQRFIVPRGYRVGLDKYGTAHLF